MHADRVTAALAEQAQQQLIPGECVRGGVDCLAANLLVGRLLARQGPQFAAARTRLREVLGCLPFRRAV
jgi:hypothetical protein